MKKSYKKSRNKLFDTLGWAGVILLLCNYIALSLGAITGASYWYHGMSLVGSILIASEAWHKRDQQPALLNIIFAFVAVIALVRIFLISL